MPLGGNAPLALHVRQIEQIVISLLRAARLGSCPNGTTEFSERF
jgi:hypothetical protein